MEQTANLNDLYRELKAIQKSMVTKEELERFIETFEIVSNKKTMKQVDSSEKDIREGKVKKINSIHEI